MKFGNAYLFCGLPGAGKSTAAKHAAVGTDGTLFNMGEEVRREAKDQLGRVPESEELGEFSTEVRNNRGKEWIAEKIVREITAGRRDVTYPVFIDGIRCMEEVRTFRQLFTPAELIYVAANISRRASRINDRGRDGEDNFDLLEVSQRDEREYDWGMREIVEVERYDHKLVNEGSPGRMKWDLGSIIPELTALTV